LVKNEAFPIVAPSSSKYIPIEVLAAGDDPDPLANTISMPPEEVKAWLVIGSGPLASVKRSLGVKTVLPVVVAVRLLLCVDCTPAGAAVHAAWAGTAAVATIANAGVSASRTLRARCAALRGALRPNVDGDPRSRGIS